MKTISTAIVVSGLKKQAAKHFKALEISTIKTNESLQQVTDHLKALKAIRKITEDKYDAIVNPSKDAAKKTKEAADDLFNPFFNEVDTIIVETKGKILLYSDKQDEKIKKLDVSFNRGGMRPSTLMKKQASTEAVADGLQTRHVWKAQVTNPKKVPVKFMMPDMVAIVKACKAGKVPPGVKWVQVKNLAI